jgi:hypothetical protein
MICNAPVALLPADMDGKLGHNMTNGWVANGWKG